VAAAAGAIQAPAVGTTIIFVLLVWRTEKSRLQLGGGQGRQRGQDVQTLQLGPFGGELPLPASFNAGHAELPATAQAMHALLLLATFYRLVDCELLASTRTWILAPLLQYVNSRTYNMVVSVCIKARDLKSALQAADMMQIAGLKRDTILYTNLIKGA
jgi:pentatricopeptide repeat protein